MQTECAPEAHSGCGHSHNPSSPRQRATTTTGEQSPLLCSTRPPQTTQGAVGDGASTSSSSMARARLKRHERPSIAPTSKCEEAPRRRLTRGTGRGDGPPRGKKGWQPAALRASAPAGTLAPTWLAAVGGCGHKKIPMGTTQITWRRGGSPDRPTRPLGGPQRARCPSRHSRMRQASALNAVAQSPNCCAIAPRAHMCAGARGQTENRVSSL